MINLARACLIPVQSLTKQTMMMEKCSVSTCCTKSREIFLVIVIVTDESFPSEGRLYSVMGNDLAIL